MLPPVVARMWGREPVSRRGPRPRLALSAILDAAIEIADAEGLAGVSMGGVASRVGVAPMALYRYVGSKDELLALMSDAAAPEPPEHGDLPWRDYLARWTRANRDFLLARPWLLSVDRFTPPLGPRGLRWLDRALGAMARTGLDDGQQVRAVTALTGYAQSNAILVHGMRMGAEPAGQDGRDGVVGAAHYGQVLEELLTPDDYPALTAAVRGGVFTGSEDWVDDADFRFGLDLLLDGIEALVARN
jgi:AcrR family transcriptional regulator